MFLPLHNTGYAPYLGYKTPNHILPTIKSTLHNLFFNTALHFQEMVGYASVISKFKDLRVFIQHNLISHAGGSGLVDRQTGCRGD